MKIREQRKKNELNPKKKIIIGVSSALVVAFISTVIVVATSGGGTKELPTDTISVNEKGVDGKAGIDSEKKVEKEAQNPTPPSPPPKKEKETSPEKTNIVEEADNKQSSDSDSTKEAIEPDYGDEPIKVEVEKDAEKKESPSNKKPSEVNESGDKPQDKEKDKVDPTKPDSKDKEPGVEKPNKEKPKEEKPNPDPKPPEESEEPKEPTKPDKPAKPTYLSASKAHQILSESGVFQKINNEYVLEDEWGYSVDVKVGKEHIGFIYFDGATYYAAKDTTYEEILEVVEGDEEQADLEWEYIQRIIIENEIAIQAASNAVYGAGTKEAKFLYQEILEAGKTKDGFFREF